MKLIAAALIAATALVATNAMANADLAKKSNCLACHTADKKLVGPAYQDVAKKYAGQKDAEAKLIAKVKAGGKGVWGEVPMPPNAAVKDEDIKTLVKWILAGAK
jgi:cytochrome c